MKIGVVSDTHDNIEKSKKAAQILEKEAEIVFHCGDMISPFTADLFDREFEFHAVRGNNDGEWNLKKTVDRFGNFHDNMHTVEIEGEQIAVYHGTENKIVKSLVGEYEYVFRGHTHEKNVERKEGTLLVNPGGIALPGQQENLHVAILDLKEDHIELNEIK